MISLAVPGTAPVTRDQVVELSISAGAVLALVAALALTRWSGQRPSLT